MPRTAKVVKKFKTATATGRILKDGHTILDSDVPLVLNITEEHVKRAKCGDPSQCVVAQALRDHYGPAVSGFWVAGAISKIFLGMTIIRFSTPASLRHALRNFDKSAPKGKRGKWDLPPGKYSLLPLAKSYRRGNRWEHKRNSGGTQSVFRGQQFHLPTRNAPSICQIMKQNRAA